MFGRVVFFFSFSIVAVATVANALARPAKRYPEIDCDDLVNLDSMLDSSASYPRIPAETSHRTTLTPINGLLPLPQCHYYWLESERERERENCGRLYGISLVSTRIGPCFSVVRLFELDCLPAVVETVGRRMEPSETSGFQESARGHVVVLFPSSCSCCSRLHLLR